MKYQDPWILDTFTMSRLPQEKRSEVSDWLYRNGIKASWYNKVVVYGRRAHLYTIKGNRNDITLQELPPSLAD